MKKTMCILLALLMALTLLPATALAAGETALSSERALRVDGKPAACEAYEIGGETWFKLRDVALALNSTGSRFSVDWDGETRTVCLITGEAYVPDGSEGQSKGPGAAAVPGRQTLRINGEDAGLPAWNVGGHNYFRLADLAPLLGFQADYDEDSDTAIIRAAALYARSGWIGRIYTDEVSGASVICDLSYDPTLWPVREEITETNDGRRTREVTAYGEDGRPLTVTTYGVNSTTTITYRYDELGRETERVFDSLHEDGTKSQSVTTSEYDLWGQLIRQSSNGGETVVTFTYDENGNQTAVEQVMETPVGQWVSGSYNEYDAAGNRTRAWTVQRGEVVEQWEFTCDENGNTTQKRLDAEGNVLYAQTDAVDGAVRVTTQDYGAYSIVTTSTVDEAGTRTVVTESPAGSSRTVLWVDGENKPLRQEWTDGVRTSVTTYEYDEAGRLVRQISGDPEAPSAVNEISYDEEGRVLTSVYAGSDYREEESFAYDPGEGKVTHRRRITYPAPSEMKLLYESMTLPAGASMGQLVFFQPVNSMQEAVVWTSSDESVATVDERGIVAAVAPGQATITATSESGLTAECAVTVTEG
jgi:YD repeat-containing protein